jgi:hypothetical protein
MKFSAAIIPLLAIRVGANLRGAAGPQDSLQVFNDVTRKLSGYSVEEDYDSGAAKGKGYDESDKGGKKGGKKGVDDDESGKGGKKGGDDDYELLVQ